MNNTNSPEIPTEELVWEKPVLYKENWLNTLGVSDQGDEEFVTLPDPS